MKNKPVILVVDDLPKNIELLEAHLEPQGYEIVQAASGAEALNKLSIDHVDLVLLDVRMPGMSGFEVLTRIRADSEAQHVPVVMITAHTEIEDRVKALEAGCDDFISKPFDKHELLARVKSLLRIKFLNDEKREAREFAESVINTVREPLIALDQDLRVVNASRSFYEFFKVKPEQTVGQLIYDLGNKQWDIPLLRELLESILPEKATFDNYEVEHEFAGIGRRVMLLNARQIKRGQGKERIILLAIEDITERKRLEDLLTESEKRYKRIYETASDGIILLEKREGHIIHANPAAQNMLGYSEKTFIGRTIQDIGVSIDMSDFPSIMKTLNRDGIINYEDVPVKVQSGQNIYADIYLVDHAALAQCNIRDVSERKQTEEALLKSEEEFRLLAESMPQIVWITRPDGWNTYFNQQWVEYTGQTLVESYGHGWNKPFHPDDRQMAWDAWQHATTNNAGYSIQCRLRRADGVYKWWLIRGVPVMDEQGAVLKWFGTCTDIDDMKREADVRWEREERYRLAIQATQDGIWEWNILANQEFFSPRWCEIIGYSHDDPELPHTYNAWAERIHPDDYERVRKALTDHLEKQVRYDVDYRHRHKSGEYRWQNSKGKAIFDENGKPTKMVGCISDIHERKNAEHALIKSEKFVEDILTSVDEAFVVIDREYRILSANRAYCEQAGKSLEAILGKHCYEISHHATQPCHEPGLECMFKSALETGAPGLALHTHTDGNGQQRQVEVRTYAMKDEAGGISSVIEVITDISEKRALENQLHHAQKMEGIGTLAGGIAHDFNNILSAIIGYGHITLMKMQKDDPLRINIEHMMESSDRAAALTQSLLTFSRKQISERKLVDLNALVKKVEKFLVRVIGEDVAVRLVLAEGELTVFADAGQMEQVFMNFATNARDAMPHGGSLLIETSCVAMDKGFISVHGYGKPGTYAMTSVTDTGIGMNEETRKKIFEPFFTTKEVGKGTGLGLAMVYGIIKQNEGFINVYSEPDKGTCFRIYLPLIKAAAEEGQKAVEVPYPKGGTETILLAEDDASLRNLSIIVLEQMGYTVISANDGEETVARYRENMDKIQLLLLDVVMPKKSGIEAYDEIRKLNPDVPVLFASGYSRDMLREKALINEGAEMVHKPISPMNLLKKVREVLDLKR